MANVTTTETLRIDREILDDKDQPAMRDALNHV